MMQHAKLQYQNPFFMERLSSLPLDKFRSKEIILFLIEVAHPLVLRKSSFSEEARLQAHKFSDEK